jgi:oligoendopeptidase F
MQLPNKQKENKTRRYLPFDLEIKNWEALLPFFDELKNRAINSKEEFWNFVLDVSEVEAVISEDAGWRYIRMTVDTTNKQFEESYTQFITEIQPKLAPYEQALNEKIHHSPFKNDITVDGFDIYLRSIAKNIELYREENIPLFSEERMLAQKYNAIAGAQTIHYKGKELTMQQASIFLKSKDRNERKEVYDLISVRRLKDADELNQLFSELIQVRHKIAVNAGFDNYRDYKFEALGRFDYTVDDCAKFHQAIAQQVVPLCNVFLQELKDKLAVEVLRPYDTSAEPEGEPLKPFASGKELLEKTTSAFYKIDNYFGDCLSTMNQMGHLDLESKNGKAPGGYNYPLYETGVPFIFMNAVGLQRDLVTMVHEGGHAIHSFLTQNLEVTSFKSCPSEVAELASMSMELISMDKWDEFYSDNHELKRAKKDQLKGTLEALPWIATIDKFQHWIYTNPNHTSEERTAQWMHIRKEFAGDVVDWSGYEHNHQAMWQRQLHLFEVPFYYIEYGFAQLGAIALWKRYKEHPQQGIEGYKQALKLGYTKSIPDIYKTAGISFNFSENYVKELVEFVKGELYKT